MTDIVDMAAAIVGGRDKLLSKPNTVCLDEPISPLLHGQESVEHVFLCAEMELPIIYVPMPMAGVSAPSTMIGPVLIGNREFKWTCDPPAQTQRRPLYLWSPSIHG